MLDGEAGTVEVEPPAEALAAREQALATIEARRRRARERAHEPAQTSDGQRIEVAANIGAADEVARAVELGAEGVGLLRTEFLFLDRDTAPTEEEQREVYEQIAAGLDGRPLRPKYDFVELGQGAVNIPGVLQILKDFRYQGWIIIELDRATGGRTPKESAVISKKFVEERLKRG